MKRACRSLLIIFVLAFLLMQLGLSGAQAQSDGRWPPRMHHSTVVLSDGTIVLMGGKGKGGTVYNDVWRTLQDDPGTFFQVSHSHGWGSRHKHASVVGFQDVIYIIGGQDERGDLYNDIWKSTDAGVNWEQISNNSPWSVRKDLAAAFSHAIYISGGEYQIPGVHLEVGRNPDFRYTVTYHNDLWYGNSEINNHIVPQGDIWEGRCGHNMLRLSSGEFLVLGGHQRGGGLLDELIHFSDVWRIENPYDNWYELTDNVPGANRTHSALVESEGKIYNLGGVTGVTTDPTFWDSFFNWFRKEENKVRRETTYTYSNLVYSSTNKGANWSEAEPADNSIWSVRAGHRCVVLSDGRIILTGGGTDDELNNEVWEGKPMGNNSIRWEELEPSASRAIQYSDYWADLGLQGDAPFFVLYFQKEAGGSQEQNSSRQILAITLAKDGFTSLNQQGLTAQPGSREDVAAVFDYDEDGMADLILQNRSTGGISVWLMRAGQTGIIRDDVKVLDYTFRSDRDFSNTGGWRVAGAADYSNNGIHEIVIENLNSDRDQDSFAGVRNYWIMDTNSTERVNAEIGFNPTNSKNPEFSIAAIADLNGDGYKDLIFEKKDLSERHVWLMRTGGFNVVRTNGQGTTPINLPKFQDPDKWRIGAAIDVDGNGFDNIYAQNVDTGAVELWLTEVKENREGDVVEFEVFVRFPVNYKDTPIDNTWKLVGGSRFNAPKSGHSTTLSVPRVHKAVDVMADKSSPQEPGVTVNVTASATGFQSPEYRFYIRGADSADWLMLKDYDLESTYSWQPESEGTYRFSVWARESGSAADYEAYNTDLFFTIVSEQEEEEDYFVDSVTVTTDRKSPQEPGETITLTAGSTGSPTPEYRFYIRAPGSEAWQMVRDYSTDSSYRWRPLVEGTYRFSVWARHSGSTAEYEAFNTDLYFTISAEKKEELHRVNSLNVTADRKSPQEPGQTITITASSTGSPTPEYRFYIRAPGSGDWQMIRDYNRDNNYRWRPTVEGTYRFSVWARHSGSTADYEVFNTDLHFTIASAKEPDKPDPVIPFSVILTPDKDSPQTVGEEITFKAEATGFSNPLYSFWIEENKRWIRIQDYSTKAWSSWTPKVAGFYQVRVWVRNSGSVAEFEAEDVMPYQVTEVIKPPGGIFQPVF